MKRPVTAVIGFFLSYTLYILNIMYNQQTTIEVLPQDQQSIVIPADFPEAPLPNLLFLIVPIIIISHLIDDKVRPFLDLFFPDNLDDE